MMENMVNHGLMTTIYESKAIYELGGRNEI